MSLQLRIVTVGITHMFSISLSRYREGRCIQAPELPAALHIRDSPATLHQRILALVEHRTPRGRATNLTISPSSQHNIRREKTHSMSTLTFYKYCLLLKLKLRCMHEFTGKTSLIQTRNSFINSPRKSNAALNI